MNPKRQVVEQAIYDLEENIKTVYEIWKQSLESGITDRERDAMMETYYERRNIANRLFHDWTKVNPNSAYYDPNPTPVFSSSDFYGSNSLQKLKPRTYPIILGAATMSVEHAFQTIRRTKKFIEQLRTKLKKRKDLQESSPFQLTEAKLKQMILDEMKSNLSLDDQDQLHADIELVRELSMDLDSLRKDIAERPLYAQPEEYDKREETILNRERRIEAMAQKYNIRHYYDSPGNYDLINLMKKKFRRKSSK